MKTWRGKENDEIQGLSMHSIPEESQKLMDYKFSKKLTNFLFFKKCNGFLILKK